MLSLRDWFRLTALTVFSAVVLAESYRGAADLLGVRPWIAAATVHTLLGIIVILALRRAGRLELLAVRGVAPDAPPWLQARPWLAYLPPCVVLIGTVLLIGGSRLVAGPDAGQVSQASTAVMPPWAWVVWIPPIEELVFRGGLSQILRRKAPPLWAGWFAATAFALVHGNPTIAHLMNGQVGLPIGPFLLGLLCEVSLTLTGRLLPGIALHAACNATVALFLYGDRRWLDWLGILYL